MILRLRLLWLSHLTAAIGDIAPPGGFRMILLDNAIHQFRFVCVLHFAISVLGYGIRMVFVKLDAI